MALKNLLAAGRAPTPAVNRRHYALQAGPVWEARYFAPSGKEFFRRFSINKHGETMAKQLAEQAYARLVAEFSTSVAATPSKRKNTKNTSPKR